MLLCKSYTLPEVISEVIDICFRSTVIWRSREIFYITMPQGELSDVVTAAL